MKRNRITKSLLAVILSLSIFAGCGGGAAPTTGETPNAEAPKEAEKKEEPKKEEAPAAEAPKEEEAAPVADNTDAAAQAMGTQMKITKTSPQASFTEYKQSPFLEGKNLPPVVERLPKNPKIINEIPENQMKYEVGQYGGTFRGIRMQPTWDAVMWTALEEPLLNSPGRTMDEITPNLVESFESNADNTEFTFKFREGTKWSDGKELTTDDVKFKWEDCILNTDMNPIFPQWLKAGGIPTGEPGTLEIVDKYTFKLKFASSYGGLLLDLAGRNYTELIQPAEYMKQFHVKYADKATLDKMVADAGFSEGEWFKLYNIVQISTWDNGRPSQITTPTLGPWHLSKEGEPLKYERNPYYWKVDSIGQQLPYIDEASSTYVTNMETAGVKILAGEIDFAYEWVPLDKVALYKENEEKGGYRLLTNTMLHRTAADIFFNLTLDKEPWKTVVNDIRFRKALNLALNKQDIVDTVYYGFAKVSDMQDTEYNLDEANKLLDEMGMKKDAEGIRMAPNGEPFTIEFNYSDWMTQFSPTAQLAAEQWRQLGLKINLKQIDNGLMDQMVNANETTVSTAFSHGPVFPMWDDWSLNRWGRLWKLYHETNGKEGVKPPDEVQKFYDKMYSIRYEDPTKLPQIRQELRDLMKDNLFYFIPVEGVTQLSLINKNLKNFPDAGYLISNSYAAEQYWFAK